MQLVLKLPKGKPPFMGILFGEEFKGAQFNSEIVERFPFKDYRMIIEITPSCLNVRLICEETVKVYFYNHLAHDAENLSSWLYLTRGKSFNFGHIYDQFDKHRLILSAQNRKKFVIKVTSWELIANEDANDSLPYDITVNRREW